MLSSKSKIFENWIEFALEEIGMGCVLCEHKCQSCLLQFGPLKDQEVRFNSKK